MQKSLQACRGFTEDKFQRICALIPRRVSNDTVVKAFELMRRWQKLRKSDYAANLQKNNNAFKQHMESLTAAGGYVEDQNRWEDLAYGKSTMQHSGCEIFAAFNALHSMNCDHSLSLPELIATFERDGMVFSGRFGTAPKALEDFLKKRGYKTVFTTDETEFDRVGYENDSLVLTLYNDGNDIRKEVHTVNISKKDGLFIAHNAACDGKITGPYTSVNEVIHNINGGRAKGISLIGIKK